MKFLRLILLFPIVVLLGGATHGRPPAIGAKSQLNFNFLFAGGAYPFINHLKSGTGWSNADATRGGPAPDTLDSNGYPTSISHSGTRVQFSVPSTSEYLGTWVLKWAGTGTVSIIGCVSCGCPCTGANQKITGWTFNTQIPILTISSVAGGPITDIAVYRSIDETRYNNGEVFTQDFKSKVAEGGFGVIRYLNWQLANTTNVTKWVDRTPTSYAFYAGYTYKAAYYAGLSTRSAGDAYAITLGSGAPTDRQTIHVLWDADSVGATPTVNLNGTGAVPLVDPFVATLVVGTNTPQNGRTATIVYDADLNKWLLFGGGAVTFNVGIINGVSPEYLVQLANELHMNPWFVAPPLAGNPLSDHSYPDYMVQLATYARDNGFVGITPRYEGPSNEDWNALFFGTAYAKAKANFYWGTNTFHQYHGMGVSLLGQAVSAIYSADRSKYRLIDGVQQTTGNDTTSSDVRLSAAAWVAAGTPTSPYTVSAAYNWVTHIAPSSYIGATQSNAAELANAYAYVVTNAGNPSAQDALATAFVNSSYDASCVLPFTTAHCSSGLNSKTYLYQQWFAWAQGLGKAWAGKNIGMTAYEGDPSPDYFTVGSAGDSVATGGSGGGDAVMTAVSAPGPVTTITLDAGSAVPAVGMAVRPRGTGSGLTVATNSSVSISAASPAQVTWSGNTLLANQPVVFNNGAVPTGLSIDTVYYVKTPGNPFTISTTAGGAAINTTGTAQTSVGIAGWTVTNVSGQVVTLDVDSTAFGTSTPATAQFMGAALLRNTLRFASKSATLMQQLTTDNMIAFVTAGGIVPSNYQFTGDDSPLLGSDVWSTLPSQYTTTSPRWEADKAYNANRSLNFLLRRDVDPASNDNTPMWLEKAA